MKTGHGMPHGQPLSGPTSLHPSDAQGKDGRPMATACGGFESSNHKHPPKERGSAHSSLPKCLFFLVGVYNRSPEFSLLQSCGTFHDFHFLLEISVL